MTDSEIKNLFRKYIQNECNLEEYRVIVQYLKVSTYDYLFREVIESEKFPEEDDKIKYLFDEEVFERVSKKLTERVEKEKSSERLKHKAWLNIAAAIAGFLLITGSLYFFMLDASQIIKYSTGYGETKTVMLADGSEVTLNSNTTLTAFNKVNDLIAREVSIEGEAYFKIKQKPGGESRNFVVHVNELNIQVLGTEFNVNNRRGKTSVVLNSGKVKLETGAATSRQERFMKPGDLVEFDPEENVFSYETVNPEIYSSWKENVLVFNNSSLLEIAEMIEDNYGYKVIIKDSTLMSRKLTARYPANNVEILLTAMSKLFQVDISKSSNEIIIQNK